ncbi:MAG: hypothetical protein GYA16_01485 [Spirochaetes bacterium]|nr:hypothetical protein [Spirochaetota bacterium]
MTKGIDYNFPLETLFDYTEIYDTLAEMQLQYNKHLNNKKKNTFSKYAIPGSKNHTKIKVPAIKR